MSWFCGVAWLSVGRIEICARSTAISWSAVKVSRFGMSVPYPQAQEEGLSLSDLMIYLRFGDKRANLRCSNVFPSSLDSSSLQPPRVVVTEVPCLLNLILYLEDRGQSLLKVLISIRLSGLNVRNQRLYISVAISVIPC